MKNEYTKMIKARVVQSKGANAYAVKRAGKDVRQLGYQRMILKSDGRPAITRLKEAIRNKGAETMILEESPVGDSQTNGVAEKATQAAQGQARTLKSQLDSRY